MSEEVFLKGFNKMKAGERRLWISDIECGAFKILPATVDDEEVNRVAGLAGDDEEVNRVARQAGDDEEVDDEEVDRVSGPVQDEQAGETSDEDAWDSAEDIPIATQLTQS